MSKYAIVISRFNESITQNLLKGAQSSLNDAGVATEDISVHWVPGAFEIPCLAMHLAQTDRYAAIVCLGAVIQGETPHFDYICQEVARGIGEVGLTTGVPAVFGILTTDTLAQAVARSGELVNNKGCDAAFAALEMVKRIDEIDAEDK